MTTAIDNELSTKMVSDFENLQRLAAMLVKSGFFPGAKDIAQAGVKILAGQAMGIPPVQAIMGCFFVNGRLGFEATILAAALKQRGYSYLPIRHDNKGAAIKFFSPQGQEIGISEFTEDDAKTAGLLGKDNYKKWPRNMFWARAMANGCRWFCADVFGGPVYLAEELGADVDQEGHVVEVTPAARIEQTPSATVLDLNAKLAEATKPKPAKPQKVEAPAKAVLPDTETDVYTDPRFDQELPGE